MQKPITMKGFMVLVMKPRNTGLPWTDEEIRALKTCIRHLAHYVPFMIIFLLPFGSLLLPAMAEVLDRRREHEDLIKFFWPVISGL